MATSSQPDTNETLITLLTNTTNLLTQFLNNPTPPSNLADPPAPLPLIRDSATLLKAHVTKLSLLVITPPFTPSAVGRVVRELSSTCLPALQAASEICAPETWGRILSQEVRSSVGRTLREAKALLEEVRVVAEQEAKKEGGDEGALKGQSKSNSKSKAKDARGKPDLTMTGVLFEAVDALVSLANAGITGLVVRKAEGYRAVLRDALEELKEWGEQSAEDDAEGESDDDVDSADGEIMLFGAEKKLSEDDAELKALLERTLKKVRMVDVLFQALVKRRLKTVQMGNVDSPGHKEVVERLDGLVEGMKDIPDALDELAEAFYEIDEESVKSGLDACCSKAMGLTTLASSTWKGGEDEFTTWASKWREAFQS